MNKIDLPKDKALAGQILEAQAAHTAKKIEMGYIGRMFGIAKEKPGNIAGLVVVASLFFLEESYGEKSQQRYLKRIALC